jgi:hypothetical protein
MAIGRLRGQGSAAVSTPSDRYEIAINGTPRTYRNREDHAREAAILLKTNLPHSEITVRDMWTRKVTVIKAPDDLLGGRPPLGQQS